MPAPSTADDFIAIVKKSGLLPPDRLEGFVAASRSQGTLPAEALRCAHALIQEGLLTKYQAEQLLGGRWRNFILGGKYKLLERLGRGGMAQVFLCEHQVMKRLVAVKILPTSHAEDRELLGRFHREARALSQLRHPNIVGAYDIDQAGKVHFLVMEYIDGGDFEVLVQKVGPLPVERAAHYIRQAAHGLQHAHECGLVHRDIKPGNLLVDRAGMVKLLDLGLARIFHESTDDLTTGRDARTLLGTVDYLAPEQALDSHDVDIRADIYGLGATFYFLLAGKGLFEDGTVAQKLSWHLHRPPVPITQLRPDVPPEIVQILEKMLAKKPEERYQTPEEVDEALDPYTQSPIPPPSPLELPQLSKAARGSGQPSSFPRILGPASRTAVPVRLTPPPGKLPTIEDPDEAPAPPSPAPTVAAPPPERRPRWAGPIPLAAATVGLVAIGTIAWWPRPGSDRSPPTPAGVRAPGTGSAGGAENPDPATASTPNPSAGPGLPAKPRIELVSGSGAPRPFPSLREATREARAGDTILVRGRQVAEALELSDVEGAPRDLTIAGEPPPGEVGPVRWLPPRKIAQGRALLDVSGLEGFRLQGFAFDGEGRVGEVIRVSGRASDSILEDVGIEGAGRVGLVVRGWGGDPTRPATLRRVRFSTDHEIEAAIGFESDPDRPEASGPVRLDSCRFVGPFHAAISVAAAIEGLEVERSRFARATDAIRYRKTEPRTPFRAILKNNSFADLQRGVHYETTPPAGSSSLEVLNNVFVNTQRMATLDRVSVQPSRPAGRWIWSEETKQTPVVPPGVRHFRKSFELTSVPDKATLDIGCDESFTAWNQRDRRGSGPHRPFHPAGLCVRRGRQAPAGPERPGDPGDQRGRPTRPEARDHRRAPRPDHAPIGRSGDGRGRHQ